MKLVLWQYATVRLECIGGERVLGILESGVLCTNELRSLGTTGWTLCGIS